MKRTSLRLLFGCALAASLLLSACSGPGPAGTSTPAATGASTSTSPQQTGTSTGSGGVVTNLDDLPKALVMIEADGTFVDPQVGTVADSAGYGTGFLIDPSGIAVTANHVVTGAGLLRVTVNGESKPRSAKVLGASECSDLALIQIDGSNFNYLQWSGNSVHAGDDVYAAGFPSKKYTLTKGIISQANADGESSWASVDYVYQHTAIINPGNSGGPLVDAQAKVLGINYASTKQNEYFAISANEIKPLIDQLRGGQDVNWIGVNGQAVVSNDGSVSGVWAASVQSGSPADKAGLKPGDLITQMEGLTLAADGTMKDYCGILRSHKPGDTLSMTVERVSSGETLEGQINGRQLAVVSTAVAPTQEATGQSNQGGQWTVVKDEAGFLAVEVPPSWSDVRTGRYQNTWDNVAIDAPGLNAAPNVDNYQKNYGPGLFFFATSALFKIGDPQQVLDWSAGDLIFKNDCTDGGYQDYNDSVYNGRVHVWDKCGQSGTTVWEVAAVPSDSPTSFMVYLQINMVTSADTDAGNHILSTFDVLQNPG